MKKFIVKSDGRQFKVKATDYESAIKAVSLVKDSKVDEFLSAIYAKLGKYLKAVSSNSNSATFTTLGSRFPFIREMASKYGVEVRFGPEDTGRFTLRLTDDIRNEITINGREYDKIQRNDIVRKYGLNVEFNLTNPFVRSAKAAVYVVSGPDANKLKKILGDSVKDEANLPTTIQALVNDEEAAIKAYEVAIKNLEGKIDETQMQVLINIMKDERRHVENLYAILNGQVTEKNLEDSIHDGVDEARKLVERAGFKVKRAYGDDNEPYITVDWRGSYSELQRKVGSLKSEAKKIGYKDVYADDDDICFIKY